jgi:hypothetical protein
MSNPLPATLDALLTLAEDMADGLHTHEVAVGVKQNLEVPVRAAIAAVNTAEAAYAAAKATKKTQTVAVTLADSNGKAFIATARSVLEPFLGTEPSAAWEPVGFPADSLAIPSTQAERQALLGKMKDFFTANPARENAPLVITAAQANTLFQALSDARSAANQGNTNAVTLKGTRDTAVKALRKRMRGLIDELDQLLDENDPRWYAFGLTPPGAPATPEVPGGLVLAGAGPGTVDADWSDAARAEHYRVWKQLVGVDAEFVPVGSPTDSDFSIAGLPSGATVKVQITAVNDAGESLPSATQQMVVP